MALASPVMQAPGAYIFELYGPLIRVAHGRSGARVALTRLAHCATRDKQRSPAILVAYEDVVRW